MKIKRFHAFFPSGKKLLMNIMRVFILLFFGAAFSFNTIEGLAQNTKVKFDLETYLSIDEVFETIEEQTQFNFIYRSDMFSGLPKIHVKKGKISIKELLGDDALAIPFDFVVEDENIIVQESSDSLRSFTSDQQQNTITGVVADGDGVPIPGVNVSVQGTTKGTVTDFDGNYSIEANQGEILYFSSVGFQDQSITVGENHIIDVVMKEGTALDEVVVVGYGTQRERNITGAISSVSSDQIGQIPAPNVTESLQGRVSGLSVTNNGSPGEAPIVRIRGVSSISFSSTPLYIVDGLPTTDLEMISSRDIQSLNVLKDASAAAVYGSRATNGVIVITTKKGSKKGKLSVNYEGSFGVQKVTKRLNLLDLDGFKQYAINYRGEQVPRLLSPWVERPIYEGATQTYGETNTNWQDAYFRSGFMADNTISLSGGNEDSQFYVSTGHFKQEGTVPTAKFTRYNFRINSEHKVSDIFTFGENLYLASGDQDYIVNDDVTGSRTNLVNAIRMMPFIPVYDPTTIGGYRGVNSTLDGGDPTNPIEDAELKFPANKTNTKIFGTAFLDIRFADWLKFRSTFGLDYSNTLDYRFQPIFNDGGNIAGASASVATVTNNRFIFSTKLYTEQLNFEKTFGNHQVSADAIFEVQTQNLKEENANGQQNSNDLKTLNHANNVDVSTLKGRNAMVSYLGRINYIFKDRYILNAAVRRDGLSVWAPGKKWKTFPSVSMGWRMEQENFMMGQNLFSLLKLRGGYGLTGLNGVLLGNTPWLVSAQANSALYPFNNDLSGGLASSIQSMGNKDLEWETTKELNVGLDAGFFDNKLNVTLEYFKRKTDNLILNVPLAPSMGFIDSEVSENVGGMQNTGFELQVGYKDYGNLFKWSVEGNLSAVMNKVTSLSENVSKIEAGADSDFGGFNITNTVVGHPIQSFYGWKTLGIFQNQGEIDNNATQTESTAPGDIRFADLDNNGTIDLDDREFLGSFIPDFSYSFRFDAEYKGLDFSAFFQGVQGNKIYNASKVITQGMIRFFNAGTEVLDAWTPDHTNTDIPRAISSDPNGNARTSDRFLEDGSYLRLKNITIGYTFSDDLLNRLTQGTVNNLRVYLSGQNLFTITNYSGYNPEVGNRTPGSSLTNGIDFAVYPQPKAFQVGVQVGL